MVNGKPEGEDDPFVSSMDHNSRHQFTPVFLQLGQRKLPVDEAAWNSDGPWPLTIT